MASTISPLLTLPLFNCTSFNRHFVMQCAKMILRSILPVYLFLFLNLRWIFHFAGGHFRLRKLFMKNSRKCPTNSWIFSTPAWRRGLCIVASATTKQYGDVMEVSAKESEPPCYAWPDNNKVGLHFSTI